MLRDLRFERAAFIDFLRITASHGLDDQIVGKTPDLQMSTSCRTDLPIIVYLLSIYENLFMFNIMPYIMLYIMPYIFCLILYLIFCLILCLILYLIFLTICIPVNKFSLCQSKKTAFFEMSNK